ncbi:tetratricopeptide repeat protein [Streptomyces hyderabadensis]|uniref:Tetratricopeptide repeat protein n=1 Tax=Streptomyces hyderabadensis TaxID=598549 RepID=A0ABP9I7I5_9ACTN|nr:tetratricopeptide repeat protein [Streptomyces hyderabadensis]
MTARTVDEIRSDVYAADDLPYGSARSAHVEALTDEAAATGERPLLVEALCCLTDSYTFSAESHKSFVPFARLLRMWDEDPGDFDETDTERLFWMFKWITAEARNQPQVPLSSLEGWLAEMRRRYRAAGHSPRAVYSCEVSVARHLGDRERMLAAYTRWLGSDRDAMSDCQACEHDEMGQLTRDLDDAASLERWGPVLDGTHHCNRQPHEVLAWSLLPLVRLGRLDEARAHHLRGYRMVRGDEALGAAVAAHIEFCALTGNEPRGLEILAEQSARWGHEGDPLARLHWLEAVALLARRLVDHGHAERPVPGPDGSEWTAARLRAHVTDEAYDLAARFDTRNGNRHISDCTHRRITAEPLLAALPLGLRTEIIARPAPGPVQASGTVPGPGGRATDDVGKDTDELVAEARHRSELAHPAAWQAWDAAERAGARLSDADQGDALEARAALRARESGPGSLHELLTAAADAHERAGHPGKALLARARAVLGSGIQEDGEVPAAALAPLAELHDRLLSLHAAGRATTEQVATVRLLHARVRTSLLDSATGTPDGGEVPHGAAPDGGEEPCDEAAAAARDAEAVALESELERLVFFVQQHIDAASAYTALAGARELQARLVGRRATTRAISMWKDAIAYHRNARRPWAATTAELGLAQALMENEEFDAAADLVRGVLADEARTTLLGARERSRFSFVLAHAVPGDEGAAPLLDAAHQADLAGESGTLGALARLRLAGLHCRREAYEEAATILESVLPDLVAPEHGHRESDLVQARVWLAESYTATDEPRLAAEQYALAADTVQHWADQGHHAILTHRAAEALAESGMPRESARAYGRAAALWRTVGNDGALVRALRARAWQELAAGEPASGDAVMAEAVHENERALREAEAAGAAEAREELGRELGHTHHQRARLVLDSVEGPPDETGGEEALRHLERASAAFLACGAAGLPDHGRIEVLAAGLELFIGRAAAAAERAHAVTRTLRDAPDPDGTLAGLTEECAEINEAARQALSEESDR